MDSNTTENLNQQRQMRRKRVNRMKIEIILFIFGWILISMIAIIVLVVQVVQLNLRYDRLEEAVLYNSTGMDESEPVSEQTLPTESDMDNSGDNYGDVVTGIDSDDNMAQAGDIHKVYLTFDGGPNQNTEEILNVLAEYDTKATFFVIGTEDEQMLSLYQRIVNDGHTLGMHSYSNQYSEIYASREAFEADFNRISDLLYDTTGQQSLYYRFPGGSSNEISNVNMVELVQFLNQENVAYFDWNVSAGDAASDYTVEDVISNVTEGVVRYKTSVVLLHDGPNHSTTVEALGPLIEALRNMGAEILPIDENTKVIQYIQADSVN